MTEQEALDALEQALAVAHTRADDELQGTLVSAALALALWLRGLVGAGVSAENAAGYLIWIADHSAQLAFTPAAELDDVLRETRH